MAPIGLEFRMGRLGSMTPNREKAEGAAARIPVLNPSPTPPTNTIFLGLSTPLHLTPAWGNEMVHPLDSLSSFLQSSCTAEEAAACTSV